MEWHDIRDADSPELDRLAEKYHLHSLHIEDCRHGGQRAKIEEGEDYIFAVLKPVELKDDELRVTDFDLFLGPDFLITVQEGDCPTFRARIEQARKGKNGRPDQIFYRLFDLLVDTYAPLIDSMSDTIDRIEDSVLNAPGPAIMEQIFSTKRVLIELRRVLGNTRDVAGHLQRTETGLVGHDLIPFMRDVYDHLARNIDLVEMQRDLLTGAMEIYLSSVANRTNEIMKVLTVLSTIALPAIVISGFYGMNTKDLPWSNVPHATWIPAGLMALVTAGLLWMLKKFKWL